jgi:ABC-2 type transport system ATP-binding protein
MYRWMSVARAVAFEAGTRPNFDRAYAHATLDRLRIPLKKRIRSLSRGMRAQLALVFAMAGDPELLVLDDPAMGLDAVMRREFLGAMIELLGREGRSVLFSSHILADVERVADRVGILHQGRLIVDARVDELRRRVQRRFARVATDGHALVDEVPGVLRAKRLRDGWELLCLDMEGAREAALRDACRSLSEPEAATLEDLFIDLTADDASGETRALGGAA